MLCVLSIPSDKNGGMDSFEKGTLLQSLQDCSDWPLSTRIVIIIEMNTVLVDRIISQVHELIILLETEQYKLTIQEC